MAIWVRYMFFSCSLIKHNPILFVLCHCQKSCLIPIWTYFIGVCQDYGRMGAFDHVLEGIKIDFGLILKIKSYPSHFAMGLLSLFVRSV